MTARRAARLPLGALVGWMALLGCFASGRMAQASQAAGSGAAELWVTELLPTELQVAELQASELQVSEMQARGDLSKPVAAGQVTETPVTQTPDTQVPVTTLHVNVRLVDVLTSVTDANEAPIGGLDAKDFAVFDNGVKQKIALFERQTNVPLNLVLALDTSGSVRKDMTAERSAARDFIRSILRPQDSVSVVEFATEVHELVPFTNRMKAIQHGLNSLHGGAATALYEAIEKASRSLEPRQGRKVLVLVSDGGDTVDTVTYRQALEAALRADVMIYSLIDVPIEASAGRDIGGEHALITLAEQTGGRYFYLDANGVAASFQKIADDLRTQYLIGYYPNFPRDVDGFHRIQVTIPRAGGEGYRLRYRAGYYANKNPRP